MDLVNFLTNKLNDITDNELIAMSSALTDEDEDYYYDYVYDIIADYLNCDYHGYGVSKFVFGYNNLPDIVIKIPFRGYAVVNQDFVDKIDFTIYDSIEKAVLDDYDLSKHIDDFCGATSGGRYDCPSNNYCAAEEYISNHIPEEIEDMFCKVKHLFDYKRGTIIIPVYIAERAEDDYCDDEIDISYESYDSAAKFHRCYRLEDNACATFIEQYGVEKVEELYDFFAEYNICDIHNGNVMFSKEGKIVIVDFSSFQS